MFSVRSTEPGDCCCSHHGATVTGAAANITKLLLHHAGSNRTALRDSLSTAAIRPSPRKAAPSRVERRPIASPKCPCPAPRTDRRSVRTSVNQDAAAPRRLVAAQWSSAPVHASRDARVIATVLSPNHVILSDHKQWNTALPVADAFRQRAVPLRTNRRVARWDDEIVSVQATRTPV